MKDPMEEAREEIRRQEPPAELRPAYVEAAITIAAYHAGIPMFFTTIQRDRGLYLGHCSIDGGTMFVEQMGRNIDDESWLFDLAVVAEAGIALERLWTGALLPEPLPPVFLISQVCLRALLLRREVDDMRANRVLWSSFHRSMISQKLNGAASREARNIVLRNWDQIQRVAGELLQKKTLSREGIAALLAEE